MNSRVNTSLVPAGRALCARCRAGNRSESELTGAVACGLRGAECFAGVLCVSEGGLFPCPLWR